MAAPTEEATGDITPSVIGTEEDIDVVAGTGTFGLVVDLDNLALGDVVLLSADLEESNTGTHKIIWSQRYSHAIGAVHAVSPPFPVFRDAGLTFRINQETGTARAFPFTVYKYA